MRNRQITEGIDHSLVLIVRPNHQCGGVCLAALRRDWNHPTPAWLEKGCVASTVQKPELFSSALFPQDLKLLLLPLPRCVWPNGESSWYLHTGRVFCKSNGTTRCSCSCVCGRAVEHPRRGVLRAPRHCNSPFQPLCQQKQVRLVFFLDTCQDLRLWTVGGRAVLPDFDEEVGEVGRPKQMLSSVCSRSWVQSILLHRQWSDWKAARSAS